MRASLIAVVSTLTLASCSTTAAAERGGVKGKILDTTCYGPCVADADPQLYEREASVVIRRRDSGRRVAELDVNNGRFEEQLGPGKYRVAVKIDDPCWAGDSAKAKVGERGFDRVELQVANTCIL